MRVFEVNIDMWNNTDSIERVQLTLFLEEKIH